MTASWIVVDDDLYMPKSHFLHRHLPLSEQELRFITLLGLGIMMMMMTMTKMMMMMTTMLRWLRVDFAGKSIISQAPPLPPPSAKCRQLIYTHI